MSKEREFFTEAIAKQYSNYSRYIDELFRSHNATFLLFLQTLAELCRGPYLISSVTDSCLEVVKALCAFIDLVNEKYAKLLSGKATEEESDSEAEEEVKKADPLATTTVELSRKLCWLIGSLAHNLVKVKPEEIDQTKKEDEKERMARLLMSSRLLSGGIENRHMNLFTQKTKDTMADILTISNDYTLLELLTIKDT